MEPHFCYLSKSQHMSPDQQWMWRRVGLGRRCDGRGWVGSCCSDPGSLGSPLQTWSLLCSAASTAPCGSTLWPHNEAGNGHHWIVSQHLLLLSSPIPRKNNLVCNFNSLWKYCWITYISTICLSSIFTMAMISHSKYTSIVWIVYRSTQ